MRPAWLLAAEDACLCARPRRFFWRSLLYMLLICWLAVLSVLSSAEMPYNCVIHGQSVSCENVSAFGSRETVEKTSFRPTPLRRKSSRKAPGLVAMPLRQRRQ